MNLLQRILSVIGAFVCVVALGCGGTDGPVRYPLSGSVTYEGKPVVKGFITLEPDTEQGNKGPGGGCTIDNGRYQTPARMGVVGGPYRVRVIAYDGVKTVIEGEALPDGKPLFYPYQTTADFPEAAHVFDIKVPPGGGQPPESVDSAAEISSK